MDTVGAHLHDLHEDGANVEHQTETEPITANNAANRRVGRSEVVSGDARLQDCERMFNGQSGLGLHTKFKHEDRKYACNQCDYQATRQDHLKTHIQNKHEGVKYACN